MGRTTVSGFFILISVQRSKLTRSKIAVEYIDMFGLLGLLLLMITAPIQEFFNWFCKESVHKAISHKIVNLTSKGKKILRKDFTAEKCT